jgi:hypothetical protein
VPHVSTGPGVDASDIGPSIAARESSAVDFLPLLKEDGRGSHPLGPLRAAVSEGVPYVGICEDRAFLREASRLARSATAPVLTGGASFVPGLQALIVHGLARGMDRVDTVLCCAAPDTQRHRGPAMFEAMMHGAGLPVHRSSRGRAHRGARLVRARVDTVPPPVARRLVHQVYEMAELCGAGTIAFKAGTGFTAVSRALGLFAALMARTGRPRATRHWAPWCARCRGSSAGSATRQAASWSP